MSGPGQRARLFHRYLGAHSLLIGLLPFFVPVYLWQLGLGLGGICTLVGVSGLAFSVALGPWQRLARTRPLARLVGATFALELLLVALVVAAGPLLGADVASGGVRGPLVAAAVGVANGAYNAFFWTTQRTLFTALGSADDSGRRYGTLQIVVAAFLKVGILAGGVLIEAGHLPWILLLSAVVGALSTAWLAADAGAAPLHDEPPVAWRRSLSFRDDRRSAGVFAIDGVFLYLESHFWTLSLFLLVSEDPARLGAVVVVLALLFGGLFLLARSRIDRSAVDAVYRTSVALYALSWLLRMAIDERAPGAVTLALLIGVTFCTSLFRLSFNKRFFDAARAVAGDDRASGGSGTPRPDGSRSGTPRPGSSRSGSSRSDGPVAYLVVKSHVSQLWLAAVFLPLAALLHASASPPEVLLDRLYGVAAVLSLAYLLYRRPRGAADGTPDDTRGRASSGAGTPAPYGRAPGGPH